MPSAKRSANAAASRHWLGLGWHEVGFRAVRCGRPSRSSNAACRLKQRQGHAVGELIVSQVRRLLQTGEQRKLAIRAVGICVPGIVRPQDGPRVGAEYSGLGRLSAQGRDQSCRLRSGGKDRHRKRSLGVDSGRSLAGSGTRLSQRDFSGSRHRYRRRHLGRWSRAARCTWHRRRDRLACARSPVSPGVRRLRVLRIARLGRRNRQRGARSSRAAARLSRSAAQ